MYINDQFSFFLPALISMIYCPVRSWSIYAHIQWGMVMQQMKLSASSLAILRVLDTFIN